MDEIKARIRAFLARFFPNATMQDDQDIFQYGFLSSLFALQLVMFIENEFGISVDNDDLDIANFHTVNALASFVQRKRVLA